MAGRSYGYNFGSSSSSPYSFSSNYSSGLPYHGSSSGYGSSASRILSGFGSSSGLSSFSSSFDLPRPKSFGLKPALNFHSPCRVIKSSFMPSILESPRPTPPPPSVYRPLPSSTFSSTLSGVAGNRAGNDTSYRRMNIRNTANIDVVNRPPSRLEHQPRDQPSNNRKEANEASRPPAYSAPIQRDYTVGTLKRGRKVIRLQTNRLPSPETIAKAEAKPTEPAKNVAASLDICDDKEQVSKAKPAVRAYGGAERTALPVVTEAKPARPTPMTPGEKMKKKYMMHSRKGPKKDSEPTTQIRQSRLEELSTALPLIAGSPAASPPPSPKLTSFKPLPPAETLLPKPSLPEAPKPVEPSLPKPSKPVPIPAAAAPRPAYPVTLVSPSKDSGLGSSPVVLIPPVYNPHYRDPKLKFLPRPQQSRILSILILLLSCYLHGTCRVNDLGIELFRLTILVFTLANSDSGACWGGDLRRRLSVENGCSLASLAGDARWTQQRSKRKRNRTYNQTWMPCSQFDYT